MGYNTSVIVLNDALNDIASDLHFGKNLAAAVAQVTRGHRVDVPALSHVNAATVIETHHADLTSVVTFGGNLGLHQFTRHGWKHNEWQTQIELIRAWADKHGYRLVKKPVKP